MHPIKRHNPGYLPSASLIIATYNWPEALELCLISVMKQVQLPLEVIIADDGSREDTRKLITAFQQNSPVPVIHVWQPDEGFKLARIRNKAMAGAKGEYLIQIDGDIVIHPLFISDHLNAASTSHFIGGSRVIIDKERSEEMIRTRSTRVSLLRTGVQNKLNGLHFPGIARLINFLREEKGLYNLRGCNMSFWKKDIIAVNGFNEEISGWGREDTELAIRLYNSGVKRVYFKLQGVAYHLYHKEYDRSRLLQNDEIVKEALAKKSSWCEKGISQYLQ